MSTRESASGAVRRNVATVLRERGMSRAELARETGIPYQTLTRQLTGRSSHMTTEDLVLICQALELAIDEALSPG